MRRIALTCAFLLVAACTPREPLPEVKEELKRFDADYADAQNRIAAIGKELTPGEKDFRGRVARQDLDEWAFPSTTREKIANLRDEAARSNGVPDAIATLERARGLFRDAQDNAAAIDLYWTKKMPAPYWRRYWERLYSANGLAPDEPDSMLIKIEAGMIHSLERGDFAAANHDADALLPVFYESLSRASSRILKQRQSVVVFKPRKTPCVRGAKPDNSRRGPRLYRAESLDAFYPADALKRGEAGAVVLRAQIDDKGCATAVAIVVHSGVESLDTAALEWFETAQFAPAFEDGSTKKSELAFKVKFVVQDATP